MEDPIQLKILIVGCTGVGKGCLLLRYTEDDYPIKKTNQIIGMDYKTKIINYNNQAVNLQIWYIEILERYYSILPSTLFR